MDKTILENITVLQPSLLEKITILRRFDDTLIYLLSVDTDPEILDSTIEYMKRTPFYDDFDGLKTKTITKNFGVKIYLQMVTDATFAAHMDNLFSALGTF